MVDEAGFRVPQRLIILVVDSKVWRVVLRFEVVTEMFSGYIMHIRGVKEDVTVIGSNRREIVMRYLCAEGVPNRTLYLVRGCLIHHLPSVVGG